jgi:lysophospholipase L1-like esterase
MTLRALPRALGALAFDAWKVLGAVVLLIILIEAGAGLLIWARKPQGHAVGGRVDTRIHADDFRKADWAEEYFREHWEADATRWSSYVYWRRKAYAGKYINIDEHGVRRTTGAGPAGAPGNRPQRIMFFGGSTMWGTGARDDHTIPSLVAAGLAKRGIAVQAVNFAEGGYVSTQGLLELMLQLRNGDTPDLAVFYDGINDTYSSLQSGVAGIPQNERNRTREFNLTLHYDLSRLRRTALVESLKELNTYVLLQRLVRRFGGGTGYDGRLPEPPDPRALAERTVSVYRDNLRKVALLGESYGFKTLFYWQPVIYGKPSLSEYEKDLRGSRLAADMEPFFRQAYGLVNEASADIGKTVRFHNIAALFADVSEPVYIDWAHLSERGNALVAARMIEDIAPLLERGAVSR